MKVNRWLILLLMLVGFGVGAISLYTASLSGVMGKMGLLGGDFRDSVKTNELARLIMSRKGSTTCGLWATSRSIPAYFYSNGDERVRLSRQLGGQRIACGVRYVQSGNVQRGVYTIMKGMYYLKAHYGELRALSLSDSSKCAMLEPREYEEWIEDYLMATEGRAHELVIQIYQQVVAERASVEELCTK